jgi:hypothetical protein
MTRTFEAYGPKGNLLRTFGFRDQAEAYRDRMAMLDTEITIKVARMQRRAA